MPDYEILITEVTNYGDLRCVAGWDHNRKEMIRPEPHPKGFWPSNQFGAVGFDRGTIVSFAAGPPNPLTAFPHRTEDRVVTGKITAVRKPNKDELWKMLKATEDPDLDTIFSSQLVYDGNKAYVPHNANARSLGLVHK